MLRLCERAISWCSGCCSASSADKWCSVWRMPCLPHFLNVAHLLSLYYFVVKKRYSLGTILLGASIIGVKIQTPRRLSRFFTIIEYIYTSGERVTNTHDYHISVRPSKNARHRKQYWAQSGWQSVWSEASWGLRRDYLGLWLICLNLYVFLHYIFLDSLLFNTTDSSSFRFKRKKKVGLESLSYS